MFYTNDVLYHQILKEEVLKVERGVIVNRDANDCLVHTKKNNVYYLDSSFFDKYNIDALFDEENVFVGWDVWRCKKTEANKRRISRLNENRAITKG